MRFRTIAFGMLILVGCAAQPSPLSPNHPASPAAPEAPPLPTSTTLSNDPLTPPSIDESEPPPISGHHHPSVREQAAAPDSYRYPMHPDARSDRPGSCPICGMRLQQEGQ
jgi:hypothetical protein